MFSTLLKTWIIQSISDLLAEPKYQNNIIWSTMYSSVFQPFSSRGTSRKFQIIWRNLKALYSTIHSIFREPSKELAEPRLKNTDVQCTVCTVYRICQYHRWKKTDLKNDKLKIVQTITLWTTWFKTSKIKCSTSSQFHQHFTSSFCAHILLPKKFQSQIVIREKLHKTLLYEKSLSKMMMKLAPKQQS